MYHLPIIPWTAEKQSAGTEEDNQSSDVILGQYNNFQVITESTAELKRIDVVNNEPDIKNLPNYLQFTRKLESLTIQTSQAKDLTIKVSIKLSLNCLTQLIISESKLPSQFVRLILSSAPNLETIALERLKDLINFKFNKLQPKSLPRVTSLSLSHTALSCLDLKGIVQATSALEYLDLGYVIFTDKYGIKSLLPESLGSIKRLNANRHNMCYMLHILRATPDLESLDMSFAQEVVEYDTEHRTFPKMKILNVSSKAPPLDSGSQTLLTLCQMFPKLEELNIYQLAHTYKDMINVFQDQAPMAFLKKLTCDSLRMKEEELDCLLNLTPNLKELNLSIDCIDFDIQFPPYGQSVYHANVRQKDNLEKTEEMMRKLCRLILKGYDVVAQALNREYLNKRPDDQIHINRIMAEEQQKIAQANERTSNMPKRLLDDKEDLSPKRLREG